MDIKNILNDGGRRANQSPSISIPSSPIDVKPQLPTPHLPSALPHYSHSQPPPRSHIPPPPPLPPQQIVYTGPVYQLQPPLELRHMPNEYHYRYTPTYSTYQQQPPLDYTVYQEFAQLPTHLSSHFPPDSCHDRPHPSRSVPTRPNRYTDSHHLPLHQVATDDPPRSRPRPRDRVHDPSRNQQHNTHSSRLASTRAEAYEYAHDSADDSPPYPYSQRRFRAASYARDHSPQQRVFSRAAVSSSCDASSSQEAHASRSARVDSAEHRNKLSHRYRHTEPFRHYNGYVSYHAPSYPAVHAYESRSHRQHNFGAYSTHPHVSSPAYDATAHQMRTRPHPLSEHRYRSVDRIMQPPSELRLEHDFSEEDDAPIISKGRRLKKRARVSRLVHSCHPPARGHSRHVDEDDDTLDRGEESEHYSPYDPNFLRAQSVERDSSKEPDPSACNLSTLRVIKKAKQARKRAKAKAMVVDQRRKSRGSVWSSEASASRSKKCVKKEETVFLLHDSPVRKIKTEERVSSISVDDDPVAVLESSHKTDSHAADSSSSQEVNLIVVDDTPTISDRDEETPSHSNHRLQSVVDTETSTEEGDQRTLHVEDPDEPYPQTFQEFSGIPPTAIGDLLQLWEFVSSFSKTLRLSSFKLRHLEQAIVCTERSTLLDACLTRLVQGILADNGLVDELGVSDDLVKKLTSKGTKNVATLILAALPDILSYESDEVDDNFLHCTVERLASSSDKWAFYRLLDPAGKLRIFRELVNYTAMTDLLRECVADTMEHAEEERKKAKEENAANRKRLEQQIREHKAELLQYRIKYSLVESPGDTQKEKAEDGEKANNEGENGNLPLSRKQKLLAAKKEKKDVEERRVIERGAEAIIAKIEKDRAALKTLKNLRLRNRTSISAREGELFDESIAAPSMPFTSRHDDPVRSHPIGTDRDGRCYWFFEGSGRVWIEDTKGSEWCTLNDKTGLEVLLRWLSPHRKEENELRGYIKSRLDFIGTEMAGEARELELAKAEEQEDQDSYLEVVPRCTRARKRKAESKNRAKAKKGKNIGSFLDYRNLEK